MQIIHRPVTIIALMLMLTLTLTACMARLLEPVGTQLPTPSTALFASVTTTDTANMTGAFIVTDTVTSTVAMTEASAISDTATEPDTVTNKAESDPANTATRMTPVNTASDAPHITPGATSSTATSPDAASPDATTAPAAASTVMSLTGNAAATFAPGDGYDNPISPVDVVASYYNAVDLADYERAYSYWEPAPLPYVEFAAGYAETASVQLIVQPPTRIEGAAGSLYAAVPTFLIAQHTDGSVHSFAGCITTRKSNVPAPNEADPDWYLYTGQFAEVDNFTNIPAALASACAP